MTTSRAPHGAGTGADRPIRRAPARKEDYKAYTERDMDDGWPYSDDPGSEEDRLENNRPYANEDAEAPDPSAHSDGWHVEDVPDALDEEETGPDETVRDYIDETDVGADPEDGPPAGKDEEKRR